MGVLIRLSLTGPKGHDVCICKSMTNDICGLHFPSLHLPLAADTGVSAGTVQATRIKYEIIGVAHSHRVVLLGEE